MIELPDWRPAPNIRDAPDLYEAENRAIDPGGLVLAAMRELAPWAGRVLVDLGCGTGFWLPGYAEQAERVIGVEPDPDLRAIARQRVAGTANAAVMAGSAEHLPLDDRSVDVVHARFAYFFGPGADAGLAEVRRVLRAGGALVVVENDYTTGEFADILRTATEGNAAFDPGSTDRWWRDRGARRVDVLSEWRCADPSELAAVLRNEFRDGAAEAWLAAHPDRRAISYGYVLFAVSRDAEP
ncbi:MAG TPA: class I SAM-dependent methyltransferase [Mycobacteriales bacterium]|nr:class I SAM-dependent methyltransferase [Mycobacteriales bacterium]